MITLDDIIDSLDDASNISEIRKKLDQRESNKFSIQSVTTRIFSSQDELFSETKVNYKDPKNQWDSEDLVIVMQLINNKWRVIRIDKAELGG